jgi:hypothetical protein
MTWCRRNENEIVVEVIDFDPTGLYAPELIWYDCPDGTEQGDFWNGTDYVKPTELPPPDANASVDALNVARDGMEIWAQDDRRRSVGAKPLIPDTDKQDWDNWMKQVYEAQDAGTIPPEPPAFARQGIELPGDVEGQCTIAWHEFGGGWPGWGFKAMFKRQDITALGLKVYDENGGYLYALTFQQGDYPGEWVTETPAGYATPTKVQRSFEIIAGSAPVTDFKTLDDTVDSINLLVRWQPQ